jgi:hypothetical protein
MAKTHGAKYMNSNALLEDVKHVRPQRDNETMAQCKTDRHVRLEAVKKMLSHEKATQTQLADCEESFIKAWVHGLRLDPAARDGIKLAYYESTLGNKKTMSFNDVLVKAQAREKLAGGRKRATEDRDDRASKTRRKDRAAPTNAQQPVDTVEGIRKAVSESVGQASKEIASQLANQLKAQIAAMLPAPPAPTNAQPPTGPPPPMPPVPGAGGQAQQPPVCRKCRAKSRPCHHPYHSCVEYPGCGVCGQKGHYAADCGAACTECGVQAPPGTPRHNRHAFNCSRRESSPNFFGKGKGSGYRRGGGRGRGRG